MSRHFWDKKNGYQLNFNYYQTSLEENKNPVDYLDLCVIIKNKQLIIDNCINKNIIIKFLECYFKYAFNQNITGNSELLIMKKELENIDMISLCKMI